MGAVHKDSFWIPELLLLWVIQALPTQPVVVIVDIVGSY